MTKADRDIAGSKTEGSEVTFIDVLGFLRRNWKFLGLLTGVLSAAAVTLILLLPQLYQKEATLAANIAPGELWGSIDEVPPPTQDEIGNSAASSLESESFGDVEVLPMYDLPRRQINLVLRSRNEDSLAGATLRMVSFLETRLQETYAGELDYALQRESARAERDVERLRGALDRVRSPGEAFVLGELAQKESQREDLERVRGELSQSSAAEVISVRVLTESDVQQSRTPAALIVLAVVASFAAAVALALAREAFARRK